MSPGRPAAARRERDAVSALFDDPEKVDRALVRLVDLGVPRDLMEVVVSPRAAERHYRGRARAPGREALRYAGMGGLIGLLVGALGSLMIIAIPGFEEPGLTALVQLLGPNFATVSGAVIGAAVGFRVRRRAQRFQARAMESPESIVLVVTTRSEEETTAVARLLSDAGGAATRIER